MQMKIYLRSISIPPAVSAPQRVGRVFGAASKDQHALVASNGLALERDARVARRAQQLLEVGGPEYLDQLALVRRDPVTRWQSSDSPNATLAWHVFIEDQQEHSCEQTLQQIEQVTDRSHGVS